MTSKATAAKLEELGFRYLEDETGKTDGAHVWTGTVEPIKTAYIDGEELTGFRVHGSTRSEMDKMAIREATELQGMIHS